MTIFSMSIASICPIEFSVGKQDKSGSLYPPKVFFLKCNPVKNMRGEEGTVGHKQFVVLILSAFSAEGCSTILVFSSFPNYLCEKDDYERVQETVS